MKKIFLCVFLIALVFLAGCESNNKPQLKKVGQSQVANSEEGMNTDKEPLDYSGLLGMAVTEFAYVEGIVLSEDTEMSAILDIKCLTGEREEEYMGLKGKTLFRSFDSDQYGVPAQHIFDILWSVGDTESNVAAVDSKTVENMITQYDDHYGQHEVSEDEYGANKVTIYSWKLNDNKIFEITVYNSMSYIALHWLHNN